VTVALSWLTENLASKGYVVAAIRHEDPMIGDRSTFAGPLLRRPLDIAFVARELSQSLAAEGLIDPERVALVGYSMGGYGVLTAAGAALDPNGPARLVPGSVMLPYAQGGAQAEQRCRSAPEGGRGARAGRWRHAEGLGRQRP
jgi:alpha-beta hydrolase superfamily lysophospholipase